MKYSKDEVIQYMHEEDVKFIRLAFCDVFGRPKNISVMPDELSRAFEYGIAFDASQIAGFGSRPYGDLLLHPETDTIMPLPWRPEHGRVVQMFSSITFPDGTPFPCDTRSLLKKTAARTKQEGYGFTFGTKQEFYLFQLDDDGNPTDIPCDQAGYLDIAPEDHGENVRREICLTLEQMSIRPESSHHEAGPGQNEIDFRAADPLTAADNAMTFQRVVKTVSYRNGLAADFSPKPIGDAPGNAFQISISPVPYTGDSEFRSMTAGLLRHVDAMTAFLNPGKHSYRRLHTGSTPDRIAWSQSNLSQVIRTPSVPGRPQCAELRSPDPTANPYLAISLMICAAADGMKNRLELCDPLEADMEKPASERRLPEHFDEACSIASKSGFIRSHIPSEILDIYCRK